MKRFVVVLIALVLALSAFALVGCGGDDYLSGRYELTSLVFEGDEMLELYEELGMDFGGGYLEFDDDGAFTLDMAALGLETIGGTYTVSGNTVTMEANDETIEAAMDGDTLTIRDDESDTTMVFVKQD